MMLQCLQVLAITRRQMQHLPRQLKITLLNYKLIKMEEIEFKFKTNLAGQECIVSITPYLDSVIGLHRWSVDMDDPNKILTVHVADPGHTILVAAAIEKAGYSAVLVGGSAEKDLGEGSLHFLGS